VRILPSFFLNPSHISSTSPPQAVFWDLTAFRESSRVYCVYWLIQISAQAEATTSSSSRQPTATVKRQLSSPSPSLSPPPASSPAPPTKRSRRISPSPTQAAVAPSAEVPVQLHQLPSPISRANMSSDGEEDIQYLDDEFDEDGFGEAGSDDGEAKFAACRASKLTQQSIRCPMWNTMPSVRVSRVRTAPPRICAGRG
jgi:hypothetical protein